MQKDLLPSSAFHQSVSYLAQLITQSEAEAWPSEYKNRETGKVYTPHNEQEHLFVFSDTPRYPAVVGAEGSGKSVAAIIKNLDKLRRGMSGIMVSPDLEHFKKSLWPEFQRWCPWNQVIARHLYRQDVAYEPQKPFRLVFKNGAVLQCGGIERPSSWAGPNINFWHFDEAWRAKNGEALKILDGRARINGPNNEPPQGYVSSTPDMNWLYDYYGPLVQDDPFASFKANSFVVKLTQAGNRENLSSDFLEARHSSLTEAEKRVWLEGEWEDLHADEHFLPDILWWDRAAEEVLPLYQNEPMVLAADAGVSNDNFGLVGVTYHPTEYTLALDYDRPKRLLVRLAMKWEPRGDKIDFDEVEKVIRAIIEQYNVVQFCYDPYQLHQMGTSLQSVVWSEPFSQGIERLEADKQLLDLIMARRVAHDGNRDLRAHLDNANRKPDPETRKLRIVKRTESRKIDTAVALSMACYRLLKLAV